MKQRCGIFENSVGCAITGLTEGAEQWGGALNPKLSFGLVHNKRERFMCVRFHI